MIRARLLLPAHVLRFRFLSLWRTVLGLLLPPTAAFAVAPVVWWVSLGHL